MRTCFWLLIALLSFCSNAFTFEEEDARLTGDVWEEYARFFQKNGYVWIKDFFSEHQVKLLQIWSEEINKSAETLLAFAQESHLPLEYLIQNFPGTLIVVPEASNPLQVCRAEDFLSCSPALYDLISGTVIPYLGYMLKESYVLFKDKINFKWPGGGAFLPHQDYPAYDFLGPQEHITAMVCIDPATLENGCLQIAKDWQKTFAGDPTLDAEALEQGRVVFPLVIGGKAHGSIETQYSDKISWIPLEAAPGDLILFSSFIPHYSEVNRSATPRRALFFTFNKFKEGTHRDVYYRAKRNAPDNPVFHIGTPTKALTK